MLSKRIPTIIPPISLEEAIRSTKIHSISGMLSGERAFVSTRPFRSSHHTISDVGLLGTRAQLVNSLGRNADNADPRDYDACRIWKLTLGQDANADYVGIE
jgi:magnesium chelatase subunit ChlI-like protein